MTYTGRVQGGVVVFESGQRPAEGAHVRVEVLPQQPATPSNGANQPVGEGLARLAGAAKGLPPDLAARHDHYRRQRGS